jgi:hypothetical protein
MPVSNRNERKDWKAISWDYDWILSFSDDTECPYLLTEREIQALLTFMEPMAWKTRWESKIDTPIDQDVITALRDKIIDKLMRDEDCPADPCEEGCVDYLPNSSFIRYEPNDPFRTPTLLPDGYTTIPWYTNPLIPLPGVIPTDAMVNGLAIFGPDLPASGFPRFSFEFDGRGEVEIEIVNVPAGGFCLVVTDENLLNVKIVNTSSNLLDVISLAGLLAALGIDSEDANIVDTDIIEIDIPEVGHHRIDVTYLPNFGGETFLGFGGGLRRVTFCGSVTVTEEMYLQRQSPEDPCLIEQSTDGGITWQEAWRMDNCCDDVLYERYSPEGIKETSPDGVTWTEDRDSDPRFYPPTLPPLPGLPGDELRCEAANNVTGYLHSAADQIIADSAAWGNISALLGVMMSVILVIIAGASLGTLSPLALGLIGALMATGSSAFAAAMTAGVYEQFMCIVYCNTPEDGVYTEANWQAIKAQTVTDIIGIAGTFFSENLNIMGIAGMNNASRTGINEGLDCDTCPCDNTWCYNFDFSAGDGDWSQVTTGGYLNGSWPGAPGWTTTDHINTALTPDAAMRLVYIKIPLPARTITKISMVYDFTGGTYDSNALTALELAHNGVPFDTVPRSEMVDGNSQEVMYEGSWGGVTLLTAWLRSSRDISSPYDYSGSGLIRSIQVEGIGDNPFGVDNCP